MTGNINYKHDTITTLCKLWKLKWRSFVWLLLAGIVPLIIFICLSSYLDKANFADTVHGTIFLSIVTAISIELTIKIIDYFGRIKRHILMEGEYKGFAYMTDKPEIHPQTGELLNRKEYYSLKPEPETSATITLSGEDQFEITVADKANFTEATYTWKGIASFVTDNMVNIGWTQIKYDRNEPQFANAAGYKRSIVIQKEDSIKLVCFSSDNQYFGRQVFVKVCESK